MITRLMGAACVIIGCGGVGFSMASRYRKEIREMTQLQMSLQIMHSELSCRLSPLPELVLFASMRVQGCVRNILQQLGEEMQRQVSPDAFCCMQVVLNRNKDISDALIEIFLSLGRTLGDFDLQGQLAQLEAVISDCQRKLDTINEHKEDRIRQYQTLGICAGAGLAILLF